MWGDKSTDLLAPIIFLGRLNEASFSFQNFRSVEEEKWSLSLKGEVETSYLLEIKLEDKEEDWDEDLKFLSDV